MIFFLIFLITETKLKILLLFFGWVGVSGYCVSHEGTPESLIMTCKYTSAPTTKHECLYSRCRLPTFSNRFAFAFLIKLMPYFLIPGTVPGKDYLSPPSEPSASFDGSFNKENTLKEISLGRYPRIFCNVCESVSSCHSHETYNVMT